MLDLLEDRSLTWNDVQPLSYTDVLIDQVTYRLCGLTREKIAVMEKKQ